MQRSKEQLFHVASSVCPRPRIKQEAFCIWDRWEHDSVQVWAELSPAWHNQRPTLMHCAAAVLSRYRFTQWACCIPEAWALQWIKGWSHTEVPSGALPCPEGSVCLCAHVPAEALPSGHSCTGHGQNQLLLGCGQSETHTQRVPSKSQSLFLPS